MNKRTWLWIILAILGTAIYLIAMAGPMPDSLKMESPVEVLMGILLIATVVSSPLWLILLIFQRRQIQEG